MLIEKIFNVMPILDIRNIKKGGCMLALNSSKKIVINIF